MGVADNISEGYIYEVAQIQGRQGQPHFNIDCNDEIFKINDDENNYIQTKRSFNSHREVIKLIPLIGVQSLEEDPTPKYNEEDKLKLKSELHKFLGKGLILRLQEQFQIVRKKQLMSILEKKFIKMAVETY